MVILVTCPGLNQCNDSCGSHDAYTASSGPVGGLALLRGNTSAGSVMTKRQAHMSRPGFNSSLSGQNGHHLAADTFKKHFRE